MKKVFFFLLMPVFGFSVFADSISNKFSGFELSRWNNESLVSTKWGLVRGKKDIYTTWVWKGIPYASPPVGDNRWKAPRDPSFWKGVRLAVKFAPPCPQYLPFSSKIIGSEDCLYLNIWRPRNMLGNLPVFVWIHGGGNTTGSANFTPEYFGSALSVKARAVVVSINYRLGPFGWFTNPAIRNQTEEKYIDASGNYGLLDIQKSLKWVRENIAAFGGDPKNITVAGESAGAMNICALLLSPLSTGLFDKAIIRSGGFMLCSVGEGDETSMQMLKKLKNDDSRFKPAEKDSLSFLRSKSPEEILSCFKPWNFGMFELPANFTDGIVIPVQGIEAIKSGSYPVKIPVIIGSNKDETKIFLFRDSRFKNRPDFFSAVSEYGSGRWRVNGVDAVARILSEMKDQPPLYVYRFDWGSSEKNGVLPPKRGFQIGASHGMEIPFFMGTLKTSPVFSLFLLTGKNRPGAEILSDAVIEYVSSFMYTGDPNERAKNLPEWVPWSNEEGENKTLLFDSGKNELRVKMVTDEYTANLVREKIREKTTAELFSEVEAYLKESKIRINQFE